MVETEQENEALSWGDFGGESSIFQLDETTLLVTKASFGLTFIVADLVETGPIVFGWCRGFI